MTATLILDCSIAMAWCFADESTPEAAGVQDRMASEAAVVPGHWFLEVANVLAMAEKRGRISFDDSLQSSSYFRSSTFRQTTKSSGARLNICCRCAAATARPVTMPRTWTLRFAGDCLWHRSTTLFTKPPRASGCGFWGSGPAGRAHRPSHHRTAGRQNGRQAVLIPGKMVTFVVK